MYRFIRFEVTSRSENGGAKRKMINLECDGDAWQRLFVSNVHLILAYSMHVFAALGELSVSMLVTLLMLAVSALPVESAPSELTPDTFGPSVKNGLWFIEHYSPYCGHCKAFKPTWEQLIMDSEKEMPTVKLSTINCIMHGGANPNPFFFGTNASNNVCFRSL